MDKIKHELAEIEDDLVYCETHKQWEEIPDGYVYTKPKKRKKR